MGKATINAGVQKQGDALRMAGVRPVQIWVPDTRRPGFAEDCRRQSLAVGESDKADEQMERLMEEAVAEAGAWTE